MNQASPRSSAMRRCRYGQPLAPRTERAARSASRRATDAQVFAGAERLIRSWNERHARRMPMLFAPTTAAPQRSQHHFLLVYCPACRTTRDIDLRTLDRHRDAAVTSLIPSLSCRSAGLTHRLPSSYGSSAGSEHHFGILAIPELGPNVPGYVA